MILAWRGREWGGVRCKRWFGATPPRRLLLRTCPNKCYEGGAKTHACADEMHEIHRPNGGESGSREHAAEAYETKRSENEGDSKRFAA